MIFDVQRYSTHDGPGIRTVVFLKGCSLRCQWCSNPESQKRDAEILFDAKRCIRCRSCLEPQFGGAMQETAGMIVPDRTRPVPPGLGKVCPTQAIRIAGREVDSSALIAEVLKDRLFFAKSGGGVTFSGGEPLDQAEFLVPCLEQLIEAGIDVAIETCLAAPPAALAVLLPYPIEWLVDVKHIDETKFLEQTSGRLSPILDNLRTVSRSAPRVTYRIPLIPDFNDGEDDRERLFGLIAGLERTLKPARVDILPYHELAAGKYAQLGRANPYTRKPLNQVTLDRWRAAAAEWGFAVTLGG